MIDTRAVGEELQDLQHQIVGRIRKSQESMTDAIKAWTHTVQSVRPQIPALPMPTLTGKLPSPEALTAMLPKPETLVAGAYDLAGQFIAIQWKLAEQMVHAAMPLTRQGAAMFGLSPAKPAKRTASTGHKTATAKTATAAKNARSTK